jgi:hypothetical protein
MTEHGSGVEVITRVLSAIGHQITRGNCDTVNLERPLDDKDVPCFDAFYDT